MSETQHYTLQVETGVIHNDLDMKEIERLKVDRDRLKVELEQAQAKGAEMVGILGICMQALEFHVPYREEGEIAFIGVEGAKRLLEGNPGQALLDRLEKLERVRDGAALALYAEEHLLGCDSYARKLREALAAGPPKESLPEGGETCRWMKKNGSKMTTT